MSDEQKEADGCAVRFSNRPCAEMLVTVVRVLPFAIEKVVRLVRHKRLIAYVVHRGTLLWRREPSRGVHALDKGGRRQYATAPRSRFDSSHRQREPGNGILRDKVGVGGGDRGAPQTMLVSWTPKMRQLVKVEPCP